MTRILNRSCKLLLITFTGICGFNSVHAQHSQNAANQTVVAADPQYNKAGKFKRVLLGEHYRKDWATEVELEILEFETMAGGLSPIKLGGGMQTSSLRLKGVNGKEYVLRSVRKDPSKALPEAFVGTIADDVLQDQISSSNPFAAVAVSSLAQSAGILHSKPAIFYVPASTRLGEYSNLFANTICIFEERPTGNQENNPSMGYSKNIINSQKLFEKLLSDSRYRVEERAFLKARLFDMLIGDWDRHEDQWTWAEFEKGNQVLYKPVPRDRDQAFAKLDGVLPQFAQQPWAVRKTKDFDYKIHDVEGLNMSGNALDRNFTTRLTEKDWVNISNELQKDLTDGIIENAVNKMPAEIVAISGKEIIAKLKSRRNLLTKYALEYYRFLSKEINVTGTKAAESFLVKRSGNDSTEVVVFGKRKNEEQIIFRRVFLHSETKEIRLYGLGGNDVFKLEGAAEKGIMVRVIGGNGNDSIIDRSVVGSVMLHKTKIYDNEDTHVITGSEGRKYISNDTLKNDYNRKAFTYDWFGPKQSPGYNPDDGIYFGGGITFRKQQFGKQPYGYSHSVWANYAAQTGAYNFWYKAEFKEFLGRWDLYLDAKINAPNYVRNYYGLSNETEMQVDDRKYYRVRLNQEATSASLGRRFGKYHYLSAGVGFETIKAEKTASRFITDVSAELDSAVFDRNYFVNTSVTYQYNTLDNQLFPRKGVRLSAGLNYVKNIREEKSFVRFEYESSMFLSSGRWTAALRSGLATNLNDEFEFYQANTLGSLTNLRGFRRDRFAGKTSLYNNTEVRFKINTYRGYIFRGDYGFFTFFDNGRVWMPGEKSNDWHSGYGGGFWLFLYNKIPITASYGISKEDQVLNIKAGFLF